MRGKRGSYFYVIDAFIAATIIIFTITIIVRYGTVDSSNTKNIYICENFFSYLQSIQARDTSNPDVMDVLANGTFGRGDQNLLTLMTQLYHRNQTGCTPCHAWLYNITKYYVDALIRDEFGARFAINDTTIYERSSEKKAQARLHLTSQRLTFYQENETSFYGPTTAVLEVWQ